MDEHPMSDAAVAPWRAELTVGRSLYPEVIASYEDVRVIAREAARSLGLSPPSLAITLDARLEPRAFRIASSNQSETTPPNEGLPAGAILVRSSPSFVRAQLESDAALVPDVQPWPDPAQPNLTVSVVYNMPFDQVRAKFIEFGSIVLTAVHAVGITVGRWLRHAAVDRFDEVSAAQLVAQLPVYDATALLRVCPIDKVAALLRTLLRDGLPLGEFASIAPLVADESRVCWTEKGRVTAAYPGYLLMAAPRPEDEAERRRVIARAIAVPRWLQRRSVGEPLQVWVLDEIGGWVPPDGAIAQDVEHFDAQLLAQTEPAAAANGAIVLTSPARRAYIGERLRPHYRDLIVVGYHELPRGVPVQRRGTVRALPPKRSEPAPKSRSWRSQS